MITKCKSGRGSRVCARAGIARRGFLWLSGAAVAGGLADVPRAAAEEGNSAPTFLMIHGSWHGAWCFKFVENLLTNNGFRVLALDLPGHGLDAQFPASYLAGILYSTDVSPVAGITLDDYTEAVVQSILELRGGGPLIVLGHSLGGIVVNEIGERLGPEVIKHMVYLTAFMTPARETGNDVITLTTQNGSYVCGLSDTGKRLSAEDGERIVRVVAHHVGAEVHPGAPRISAGLPENGERFEGLIPPIVEAPAFAIRKPAVAIFTLRDYARAGIMTAEQAEFLCDAVSQRRNILVAGGTSTGKTTLVNALLAEVAWTADRVILIEDTRELQCCGFR